jgi:hypothetical protein
LRRIREAKGDVLVVLPPDSGELAHDESLQTTVLGEFRAMSGRLRLACRNTTLATAARLRGIRVLDKPEQLDSLLRDEKRRAEAMRIMAPQFWRLHVTAQLQRMGLLSVPRLRIALLVLLSAGLFFFVVFRLLPSADIKVWARKELVTQTTNIFLVQSGATIDTTHVRTMPLLPITVTIERATTYDDITEEEIVTSAEMLLTIINRSGEEYALRQGSRLANQAGMIVRLLDSIIIDAGTEAHVRARAEERDVYGKKLGERGNVPAGVRWDFVGLGEDERKAVFAENRSPASGGTTLKRTVLVRQDLDAAKAKLEQELLTVAKKAADEQQELWNAEHPEEWREILRPQFTPLEIVRYSDFTLPEYLLGEPLGSIPVEGTITYTVFAYDASAILNLLSDELRSHVREGKELLDESLTLEHLEIRVIGFADDFSWIKLTAELTGTDRYVLEPLSPSGALFAKSVREKVAGEPTDGALRILKNMPEVESVTISIWPPWTGTLPEIPAHISIEPQD